MLKLKPSIRSKFTKPYFICYLNGSNLRVHKIDCHEIRKHRVKYQPTFFVGPDNYKKFKKKIIHIQRRLTDCWIEIYSHHELASKIMLNKIKHLCNIKHCKHCKY